MFRHRDHYVDIMFRQGIRIVAFFPIILLIMILGVLLYKASLSIHTFGFSFFTTDLWNPVKHLYGGRGVVLGTLITSGIALLISVPLSFGFASFVLLYIGSFWRNVLARVLDFMAGIPSIVFGMWGLFYFIPIMEKYINPILHNLALHSKVLEWFLGLHVLGFNYLTASIILAIMLIPIQTAMMINVFNTIPHYLIESGYGVGANKMEVLISIMVPYVKGGLAGSVVLGLGRALGETMAVTFVIGNAHTGFSGLLLPGSTISSVIANEYAEALDPLHRSSLIELGIVLFIITFISLIFMNVLLHKVRVRGGN